MEVNSLEILKTVHSFYDSAWNQLVSYTIALMALVGGLVPLIIGLAQRRAFKIERESFEAEIDKKVRTAETQLVEKIDKQFDEREKHFFEEMKRLEELFVRKVERAEGGVHYVQASAYLQNGQYAMACNSGVEAALKCLRAKDELNLRRAGENLVLEPLLHCVAQDFRNFPNLQEKLFKLTSTLRDENENGRYSDLIDDIERRAREAGERA